MILAHSPFLNHALSHHGNPRLDGAFSGFLEMLIQCELRRFSVTFGKGALALIQKKKPTSKRRPPAAHPHRPKPFKKEFH